MKFFQSVTTLEELKKQYKKLAKKHHLDLGGNEKNFIAVKVEFDQLIYALRELVNNYLDDDYPFK